MALLHLQCACELRNIAFSGSFAFYDAFRDVTNLRLLNDSVLSQLTVFGRHGATGCHATSAAAVATRADHVTATRRCTEVKVAAAARQRRGNNATRTAVPVGGATRGAHL